MVRQLVQKNPATKDIRHLQCNGEKYSSSSSSNNNNNNNDNNNNNYNNFLPRR